MKFNKKGAINPGMVGLILIVGIIAIALIWSAISSNPSTGWTDKVTSFVSTSKPIGDAWGGGKASSVNWLSYIFGNVPQGVIDLTSGPSSVIVMILIFVILFLMFSDILSTFGTFGNEYIPWIIGFVLTIIAANIKAVMFITAFSFGLISGLGAITVLVGIATPFLVYFVFHVMFLGNLKAFFMRRKNAVQFNTGVSDLEQGIRGAKAFGKAVRAP
jgi:hypothetical protein